MRSRGITFYKGFKPDIMHKYTVLETRRILTSSVLQCNKLIINHLMINPYNSCHFDPKKIYLRQLPAVEEGNGISVMRGIAVSRGIT